MNQRPSPIPLRADPHAVREAAVASLVRAAICVGLSTLDRQTHAAHHARKWDDDRALNLILRAATSPATLANTPALTTVAVSFLEALVPASAGAALLGRGVGLSFDQAASITVPGISFAPGAGFVAEGAPIPVQTGVTTAGPTLTPHKLAVVTSLTSEMLRSVNAEALVRLALIESTGAGLDAVLFDANAGSAVRPPGLLNGITPLTPAAATGAKADALADDLAALATAIAPVAGNGEIIIVTAPAQAVALVLRLAVTVPYRVFTSAGLTPRTVIVVAANALVSALEGAPIIDAGREAVLHRDTAPAEIVTAAGTVAAPVGSLFQTDSVALRLRWPISWALRDSRGVAWMQNVNW